MLFRFGVLQAPTSLNRSRIPSASELACGLGLCASDDMPHEEDYMRVTFGLHVGTWHGPGAKSHLGEPVLGRAGFLALLETHLGLSAPAVSPARRAAAYLVALRGADEPGRFFHGSLAADELGTAAHLLRWRDEWMLSGWDGQVVAAWKGRLADLAAVEACAGGRLPPGEGERLARVAERLQHRRTPIESVILLDPLPLFPARWQDVLGQLRTTTAVQAPPAASGDLGRIQAGCLQALATHTLPTINQLESDASVQVLRPLSRETAEHWLASLCKDTAHPSRLIVAEEHGAALDDTLRVHGVPACGFDAASALRPALQALPLALETLWDPIEPGRLLEFLTHPIGPFSGKARRTLGEAFAQEPGIGGSAWLHARASIQQSAGEAVIDRIALWLETARSKRSTGALVDVVIARVTELRQSILGRQARPETPLTLARDLQAAVGQCTAVIDCLQELQRQGVTTVRPRLLEQLTTQATTDAGCKLALAEVGCMQSASSPAACAVDTAAEVLWWMPAKPVLPSAHPWVQSELAALADAGIRLRDPAAEMAGLMAQWLRPILAARQRLTLVLPPAGCEDHPAWQLLHAMVPDLQVHELEQHAERLGQMREVTSRPLAAARGSWQLDPSAAWRVHYPAPTRHDNQSYSSLDVLLNNPALAVLRDAAALRAGRTVAVQHTARLLGTLAHRLVERLLANQEAIAWTEDRLGSWFQPALEDLLVREAMPLLAAGSTLQLQQFRDVVRRGISVLLENLRAANAVRAYAERQLDGSLGAIQLTGKTDLYIELPQGRTAALDLKWSRAARFRKQLANGEYLQLALYAHMIEQQQGRAPAAVGYFTFMDAQLLTSTPGVFGPGARVVASREGFDAPQLVQMACESWNWRVRQWNEGIVEVVGHDVDPPSSEPPPGCLPLRELGPWYADYEVLFGQREGA